MSSTGPARSPGWLDSRRLTVRTLLAAVAAVACLLWIVDAVEMQARANRYRRKAEGAARMEAKCRRIDALDPATRAAEDADALDDPYLHDPAWNRQMIGYYVYLRQKYEEAAAYPRRPVPPDRPSPQL